jgi:hypothetical protein
LQYPFSCVPKAFHGIETSLSLARLNRYMAAANGDKHTALRLYVWNARICEAFYLPLQVAEVTIRNRIHIGVMDRYGEGWEQQGRFVCTLPRRLSSELADTIHKERRARGREFTTNHVVAGLSFGFWVNLLTRNYEHLLWKDGVTHAFPHAPPGLSRERLHIAVDRLRDWRNSIAHHYAIFDKGPTSEYQNLLGTVAWADSHTEWLIRHLSQVQQTIGRRPRI